MDSGHRGMFKLTVDEGTRMFELVDEGTAMSEQQMKLEGCSN